MIIELSDSRQPVALAEAAILIGLPVAEVRALLGVRPDVLTPRLTPCRIRQLRAIREYRARRARMVRAATA